MSRASSLATRDAALLAGEAGQRKRLSFHAYTVAFICPLEVELSAARYMLDEEHVRLSSVASDTNQYILGEILGHNVAIASLPAGYHGKISAATVSRNMARTYPSIKLRFLIGVGGGVPRDGVDVRLGDVVVGTPSSTNGGVVQYDLGKQTTTGFLQKGFLCPPPSELLSVLQIIRSNHRTRANMIPKFIGEMIEKQPSLAGYTRPSQHSDILFQSNYEHEPGQITCENCDKSKSIARNQRTASHQPVIHYGTIASGDRVMKDGKERDNISRLCEDAICFEMEAAGLMNDFRCIVIRGISDYADSHKNDVWQPYAAAAAAAFAKEMLSFIDNSAELGSAGSLKSDTMISFGSTTSGEELSNSPHLDKSSESAMGINSCDNSNRQVITSYSGFDEWLTTFLPSDTNLKSGQSVAPELTESDDISIEDSFQKLYTAETSTKAGVLGYVDLKITGLRKKVGSNIVTDQEVLLPHLSWMTSLVQLNQTLQDLGYEELYGLSHSLNDKEPLPLRLPLKWANPVIVTDGQSSYNAEKGYCINENESFGSFCYAVNQSEFSLQAALDEDDNLRVHNRYSILQIQFHRTIRVPENGVTYDLPPNLGCIPLQNVVAFGSRLPTEMNKRGGIFFPLYQREAVWLSFKATGVFSVKVFAGGINAISGLPWKEKRKTMTQDYLVVPPQVRLDGVVSAKGAVHQFVAMPIRSGYSIEQQVSGEDILGGLQVIITPAFPDRLGCWPHQGLSAIYEDCEYARENKYDLLPIDSSGRYNMSSSAKQVGLSGGKVLFICYPDIVWYKQENWGEDGYARENRPSFLYELFLNNGQIDEINSHKTVAVHQLRLKCAFIYSADKKRPEFTLNVSPWISVSELRKLIKDRFRSDRQPLVEFELYHERFRRKRHLISPKQFGLPLWRAGLRDYSKVMIQQNSKSVIELRRHRREDFAAMIPGHARAGSAGWSMALAAGGSIHQIIQKDSNPPDIWIRSVETLLNVQILNSVAYESATGMMVPPTPISSETYIKAGFPFFKEYIPAMEAAESNKAEDAATKINTVHEIDGRKNIHFHHSFETGTLVGCTHCRRNICDCILRPCNHIFCSSCVKSQMTHGLKTCCARCHGEASLVLGFSAPMTMPGHEEPQYHYRVQLLSPVD